MDVARTLAESPQAVERSARKSKARYRPDIDGLRAISVLPVVLYHLRVAPFSGGYVGVDVFFVISGYLITNLIYPEIASGRFSVLQFYERRARRILPALFLVLACSTIAAVLVLFPRDLLRFGASLGATTAFASNLFFWIQSGYFDLRADLKPLLHTWSLAVEEQFYLFFPPLLLLLHSRRRNAVLAFVTLLFASSLALSVWTVHHYPDAAFYLAPQRTWELMLGSMLALAGPPQAPNRLLRELLAVAGLVLLGFAIFSFGSTTLFPGEAALVPCVGAALLIYAGESADTWTSRLLSLSPMVFLGLISYSLYLWHWPLYVFVKYLSVEPLDYRMKAAIFVASIILAAISWRFVEQPFRGSSNKFSRGAVFALAGIATTSFSGLAVLNYALNGLPQRFSPPVQRILAEVNDSTLEPTHCSPNSGTHRDRLCVIGDKSATSFSFMLWGDSYAVALLPAVETAATRAHRKGYFFAHLGCPPILNVLNTNGPTPDCPRLNELAFEAVRATRVHQVILVGRWAMYDQGHGVGADQNEVHKLVDLDSSEPASASQHEVFRRALARTVNALRAANKDVVFVASVPEISTEVPERLALLERLGRHDPVGPTRSDFLARQAYVQRDLDALARLPNVRLIEPASTLCATGQCRVEADGIPLYQDGDHLSRFGALTLSALFAPVF